jgi:hypothetical protein
VVANRGDRNVLISLKWQQVGGTAEQKVPFEVICLMDAMDQNPNYQKAYLVLGGEGWTLRDFYISGDLQQYIPYGDRVEIVTLERFIRSKKSDQFFMSNKILTINPQTRPLSSLNHE